MAAGGTFTSQNKVRPGAYINFIGTPKSLSSVGERGVVAAPLSLSWGGQVIELTTQDLVTGASLEKAGVLFTDDEALNLRLLLQSCRRAIIYRLNAATATKATKTVAGLKVTAVHGGTFGNKIAFTAEVKMGQIMVKTFANGQLVDTQRVAAVSELIANDFVEFEIVSISIPHCSRIIYVYSIIRVIPTLQIRVVNREQIKLAHVRDFVICDLHSPACEKEIISHGLFLFVLEKRAIGAPIAWLVIVNRSVRLLRVVWVYIRLISRELVGIEFPTAIAERACIEQ